MITFWEKTQILFWKLNIPNFQKGTVVEVCECFLVKKLDLPTKVSQYEVIVLWNSMIRVLKIKKNRLENMSDKKRLIITIFMYRESID